MKFLTVFVFFIGVSLPLPDLAQAQSQGNKVEPIISTDDEYPTFRYENVSMAFNSACKCQSNFSLADSEWSEWSKCDDGGITSYACHQALRYRRRFCSDTRNQTNPCINREWRYCYHEASCKGTWVEWAEDEPPCFNGTRVRVAVCTINGNQVIGLHCAGKKRKPFEVRVESCGRQRIGSADAPTHDTTEEPQDRNATFGETTSSGTKISSDLLLEPNLTTWIAAGVGAVVILFVIILLTCVNRRRESESKETTTNGSRRKSSGHPAAAAMPDDILFYTPAPNNGSMLAHSSMTTSITDSLPVYSVPTSTVSVKTDTLQKNQLPAPDIVGSAFVESSTPFCSETLEKKKKLSMDIPQSKSTEYLETMSSHHSSQGLFHTVGREAKSHEMTKTTSFGNIQQTDLSTFTDPNMKTSHVYAEISHRSLQNPELQLPHDLHASSGVMRM